MAIVALFGLLLRESDATLRMEESYQKETQARSIAQGRLRFAMEAIRSFHSNVSEDVLFQKPELHNLRAKLLRRPLELYGASPTSRSRRMTALPRTERRSPRFTSSSGCSTTRSARRPRPSSQSTGSWPV